MTGGVLVWAVGGELIFMKKMTVGSVVAYSGYLAMFYQPVLTLARMVQMVSNSLSAAERVFAVIDATPDISDAPDAVAMPNLTGSIEFCKATFGYNKFKPVIKNLDLSIASREKIGLVGRSGAGKSTIINLLCRLYEADSGTIFIDGIDIRKIRSADLRSQIGVVLQETFLFNGTIYENISYAKPEATKEQIINAAIAANAHEFIVTKPDSYDSEVGERGVRLSGGEKQRIAIARAILRDPAILILDEALSSVDTQTENKIQEALANLTKGRTTIAIAHRLSTLRTYHRLFVIENGRCVESGTHEQLMKKKGAFFELVKMQERLSQIAPTEGTSDEPA
jgi:ATP-binding cassette subfamily B protein